MTAGMRTTTTAKARRMPWTMLSPFTPWLSPASAARTSCATSRSSAAPREALTRMVSPSRSSDRSSARASSRPGTMSTRVASRPASRAPSAMPAAPSPTTTSRSAMAAAWCPTRRCSASCWSAQLEHLAEHREAPSRQPGEEVQGCQDGIGRGVVRIVQDGPAAGPQQLRAMRHGDVAGEAPADVLEREARAGGHRGRSQGVVDTVATERRQSRRRRGRPAGRARRTCPSAPRDATSSARTSACGREAVRQHARTRVPGHRGDARIVGVEHGAAVRGQRLDELALARLDGLDRAGAREVHTAHRGHHADGGTRDVGQERDLAGRIEAHLEHRGLVLGAQPQRASAAGRSRCSRCRCCGGRGAARRGRWRSAPWSRSCPASR